MRDLRPFIYGLVLLFGMSASACAGIAFNDAMDSRNVDALLKYERDYKAEPDDAEQKERIRKVRTLRNELLWAHAKSKGERALLAYARDSTNTMRNKRAAEQLRNELLWEVAQNGSADELLAYIQDKSNPNRDHRAAHKLRDKLLWQAAVAAGPQQLRAYASDATNPNKNEERAAQEHDRQAIELAKKSEGWSELEAFGDNCMRCSAKAREESRTTACDRRAGAMKKSLDESMDAFRGAEGLAFGKRCQGTSDAADLVALAIQLQVKAATPNSSDIAKLLRWQSLAKPFARLATQTVDTSAARLVKPSILLAKKLTTRSGSVTTQVTLGCTLDVEKNVGRQLVSKHSKLVAACKRGKDQYACIRACKLNVDEASLQLGQSQLAMTASPGKGRVSEGQQLVNLSLPSKALQAHLEEAYNPQDSYPSAGLRVKDTFMSARRLVMNISVAEGPTAESQPQESIPWTSANTALALLDSRLNKIAKGLGEVITKVTKRTAKENQYAVLEHPIAQYVENALAELCSLGSKSFRPCKTATSAKSRLDWLRGKQEREQKALQAKIRREMKHWAGWAKGYAWDYARNRMKNPYSARLLDGPTLAATFAPISFLYVLELMAENGYGAMSRSTYWVALYVVPGKKGEYHVCNPGGWMKAMGEVENGFTWNAVKHIFEKCGCGQCPDD